MNLFKNLYLSDRFFYLLGGIVFLFFFSYVVSPVFYLALLALLLSAGLLVFDVFSLFRAKHIVAERVVAPVLSLSDQNKVRISLSNQSDRAFDIKLIDEIPYQFNVRDFSHSLSILAQAKEMVDYTLRPTLRGEYHFGNINVFLRSKLGIAVKREVVLAGKSIAVYPSVLQMKQQELKAMNNLLFKDGEKKVRKVGRSYEFDQIKQYVPGDDTRNVNWKATSRRNELMINHYDDERSQQIYSIIDKSRIMKMPFDNLTLVDYAINATLAFSNIVLKKKDKAGIICFSKHVDTCLKADNAQTHLKKISYLLHKEKYDYSEANYEALYKNVRKTISNRSLLFLYTNFDSIYALKRNLEILRMLNRKHLLVVVFFENTELENYSNTPSENVLDIYQKTIAKKFIDEKEKIAIELRKNKIQAIRCFPKDLTATTINKYLELKGKGLI